MLNGKLALYDIDDVEAFCVRILERNAKDLAQPGDYHQQRFQDCLAFLIATCWELSSKWGSEGSFRAGAGTILAARIIDWRRQPVQGGRTRFQFSDRTIDRPRPVMVPLEDRLDEAVSGVEVDGDRDRVQGLAWVDGERGGAPSREAVSVGRAEDGSVAA